MNIPKEIYLKIFQHLYKTQLMECSIVCKEWSLPALQTYYSKLSISGRNANYLIFIIDQDLYFQHCHWVKSLKLCQQKDFDNFYRRISSNDEEREEEDLTKEQLLKFLTYLPNLKKLKLDTSHGKNYVEYLLDLNADTYLTHLEEISIEDSLCDFNSFYDLQCNLFYKFRTSLKTLVVFQEQESNIITQYGGIINYLNHFTSLTRLEYYNYSQKAVTVYQLQVACPNLTTLKFITSGNILKYQEGSNAFLNTNNLQSLILSFPRISSSYADMLIHHLPTTLNKLYLQLENIDLYDWIHLIGIERVLKLAGRMSKLSSAEIRCEPYKEYRTKSVHEVSQMTLFFQVLNAFKGDKTVFCNVRFSDFRSIYKTMSYTNGVLNVFYGLQYQDIYGHNQDDTCLDFQLVVPDKTISNTGPEIFNRFMFYLCNSNDQIAYKILKYSLTNCPYLQHVEFVEMNNPRREFYLSDSTGREHYYTHKTFEPSTKTVDNLKVTVLNNFVPSDDFLHVLVTYLPNTYYLKCGIKMFQYCHNEELPPPSLINVSEFKKLETFDLNMDFYFTKSADICRLKISNTNEQEELYEIKKVEQNDFKINHISSDFSVAFSPTLTLNVNKMMKLVQLRMEMGKIIEIKDGVVQEAHSSDFNDIRDRSAYFD